MKSHPLIRFALFLLAGVLLFPFTVMGESLAAFTNRCEDDSRFAYFYWGFTNL